jgi:hypothetical protein
VQVPPLWRAALGESTCFNLTMGRRISIAGAAIAISLLAAACDTSSSHAVPTLGKSLRSVETVFAGQGVEHCVDSDTQAGVPPLVRKSLQNLSPGKYSKTCVEGSATQSPFNLSIGGPAMTDQVSLVSIECTMGVYTYGSGVAQFESRATVQQVDNLILATAQAVAPSSVSWLRSILPADVTSPIVTSVTANRTFGSAKVGISVAGGTQNQDVYFQIEAKNYAPITLP